MGARAESRPRRAQGPPLRRVRGRVGPMRCLVLRVTDKIVITNGGPGRVRQMLLDLAGKVNGGMVELARSRQASVRLASNLSILCLSSRLTV
jgi:hypothetical protein